MWKADKMLYRRKRKVILEELKTDNTPFPNLPRDLCEIMLDFLDTASVFNLMLVSRDSKSIAYSERHWHRRLNSLFHRETITCHPLDTRRDAKAIVPYRLVAIELINRKYDAEYFISPMAHLAYRCEITEEAVAILNDTICRYVNYTSLFLLAEFTSILQNDFPQTIGFEGSRWRLLANMLNAFQSKTFQDTNARSRIVAVFFTLIAGMHETEHNIRLSRGTVHAAIPFVIDELVPPPAPLILNETVVLKYLLMIVDTITIDYVKQKFDVLHAEDPELYSEKAFVKLVIADPQRFACPFCSFMKKYLTVERYPALAQVIADMKE